MSDRQKLLYAFLASAFIHLAIVAILASIWSMQHAAEVIKALPDLSQLTVTIMPPKPPEEVKMAPPPPPPIPVNHRLPAALSTNLTQSTEAPARAVFQSDANMKAGSLLPSTGNLPMPTQEGPARDEPGFANRRYSPKQGQNQASAAQQAAAQTSALIEEKPAAITQVVRAPQPTATPRPTPAIKNTTGDLALLTATPTPVPQPSQAPKSPRLRASADLVSPPQPSTVPSVGRAMVDKEDDVKTHINGGVKTIGPEGVDAKETPYGRYLRKLHDLILSRWLLYQQENPSDIGRVSILVKIDVRGKVTSLRVIDNHSTDNLPEVSERAILDSNFPPIPSELTPMLHDGKLELPIPFEIYDHHYDDSGR